MPSLLELQRNLRSVLLADADTAPSTIMSGAIDAAARMRVYRNNIVGNLTGALRLTFPAVERLVGAEFFAAAAAHFISAAPPRCADLYEYGAAFPGFLATFEPARGVPYLADVARLEWAVNLTLHAPLVPAVTADALLNIPGSRQPDLWFTPHPSLSLLTLAHPARSIWEAILSENAEIRTVNLAAIDITAEGDSLAVSRGREGLILLTLPPPAFDFAHALAGGRCLADALDLVPPEQAASLLGGFIAHGFFSRCDLPEDPPYPYRG